MKKEKISLVLLSLILVFSVAFTGCGSSDESTSTESDVVKIRFLGAKTGGHAIYGLGTLKGM